MLIGDKWADHGYGITTKEQSFKLLDTFFESGGNFIDTANNYQDGTSEQFIGEWMTERNNREQVVVATKYSTLFKRKPDPATPIRANYTGNHLKSMRVSVDTSLKNLRTDYIDILYVHFWDYNTSVKEVMDGLHNLVVQGKVLYLVSLLGLFHFRGDAHGHF
jgi:aryl-alcohol dehydrogenase-like predicted oxidoreductase